MADGWQPSEESQSPGADETLVGAASFPRDFGDYELLEQIGAGGMGVVYRARHKSLGRQVALKMLHFGADAAPEMVKRFQAEAMAAAALQHPHIVAVHDVGICFGRHFITMDLVRGRSLDGLVKGTPLPARRAAAYVQLIAEAAEDAHAHGILHRDLKPSNVIIDEADVPRLTDFGLARRLGADSELTAAGQILGSPSYISPEQALGHAEGLSRQSDVYALGAILYHALTGRPPFQGETIEDVLRQVIHSDPVAPRRLNSSVSRDLETICMKSLEKEPRHRYATAGLMAEDLACFLAGKAVRARPVGRWGKTWRWCRRRPALAGLAAALATAVCFGAGGVLWQWRRAEQALTHSEWEQYAATVAMAQNLIEKGQSTQASRLLNRSSLRDARGWEWGWLQAQCHRDLLAIRHQEAFGGGIMTALVYAPDGKSLYTGARDGVIRRWSTETGACLTEFPHMQGYAGFSPGSLSPDGSRLVSFTFRWGEPSTTIIWDTRTAAPLRTWTNAATLNCCAFTPDGRCVVTAGVDRKVQIRDAVTGALLRETAYGDHVFVLAVSPDGERIAFAGGARLPTQGFLDTTIRIWNWKSAHEQVLPGHPSTVLSLAFHPKSMLLASASTHDVRFWDLTTGLEVPGMRRELGAFSLSFSPSGEFLAVSGGSDTDSYAQVIELDSGKPTSDFRRLHAVRGLTFHPDGTQIATVGMDGVLRFWSAHPIPDSLDLAAHRAAVWTAAFSGDGRRVATGSLDQTLCIWDAESGELLCRVDAGVPVLSVAITGSGSAVLAPSADEAAVLYDAVSGQVLRRFAGHQMAVMAVALSDDERWVATGSKDETAILWDARSGMPARTLRGHRGWVLAIAFDPSGERVATASADGSVKVWDCGSGELAYELRNHGCAVFTVGFSPDGRWLATGARDHSLRMWDARRGRPIWHQEDAHGDGITSIAFSPRGGRLFTAAGHSALQGFSERDWSVGCWDVQTGYCLYRFNAHAGGVCSVRCSRDGTRLLTGSVDNTARIWTAFPWRAEAGALHSMDSGSPWVEQCKREQATDRAYRVEAARRAAAERISLRTIIGEISVPARPHPKREPSRGIPPRDAACGPEQIDLSEVYNAALDETWLPVTAIEEVDLNLGVLSAGLHTFRGIPFDVRGVVQLRRAVQPWAWEWQQFPAQVEIPLGRSFRRLHVLQGAINPDLQPERHGTQIGAYRLDYADGTSFSCDVRMGRETGDWRGDSARQGDFRPVWQANDPANPGRELRLFAFAYENPRPHDTVKSVAFVSALSNAGPFLVGLSVE